MNKILFTNKEQPNFHIEINAHGAKVWISLNIEKSMIKHLSPNNVFKAGKFWVYSLRRQLDQVNVIEVKKAHENLLKTAMINCRKAKQRVLEEQIQKINFK